MAVGHVHFSGFLILHYSKYLPPNMWQSVGGWRELGEGKKLDVKTHQNFFGCLEHGKVLLSWGLFLSILIN